MKGVINEYRCSICGDRYTTEEEAARCYSFGVAKSVMPVGTIVGLGEKNMVFMVARFNAAPRRHWASYPLWGFRDTGAGDNTGTEYCGDDFNAIQHIIDGRPNRYYELKELKRQARYNKVNTQTDAFARAVAHGRKLKLPMQYWDGAQFIKIKVGK